MAKRRMFSLDVVDSDAFLEMPSSTQALYFHLAVRADDDGFISNPKKILRSIGGGDDDLKLLIGKKFLIFFQDGVCVVKHWRVNNFIRKDIYDETQYVGHKKQLFIRKNGAYSLNEENALPVPEGHFQIEKLTFPSYVNVTLTSRQPSIGKGREGHLGETSSPEEFSSLLDKKKDMPWNTTSDDYEEGSIDLDGNGEITAPKKAPTKKYPNAPAVRKIFQEILGKNPADWNKNVTVLQACENLYTERGVEKIRNALEFYVENKEREYCPQINTPVDLDRKYNNLSLFKNKS